MGRRSLKSTRQKEIILALYNVARMVGLDNVSIGKVADHLDINPSLIMHYFKSRDQLILGLIDFILTQYDGIYQTNGGSYSTSKEIEALIASLFSRKWNKLFDDSVFYSCYAMTYRNKKVRTAFKRLHDSLRMMLVEALQKAKQNGVIEISDERKSAEVIFALVEGAYYYLGMADSRKEREQKISIIKEQALIILGLPRR